MDYKENKNTMNDNKNLSDIGNNKTSYVQRKGKTHKEIKNQNTSLDTNNDSKDRKNEKYMKYNVLNESFVKQNNVLNEPIVKDSLKFKQKSENTTKKKVESIITIEDDDKSENITDTCTKVDKINMRKIN